MCFNCTFSISKPPPFPLIDFMMSAFTKRCKILAVKGSGDSIFLAMSRIPQRLPADDSEAM